jgi:hypothetical protein
MEPLSRQRAPLTEKDLRNEFEALYGRKVECDMLVWPSGRRDEAERVAELLRTNKMDFSNLCRQRMQQVGGFNQVVRQQMPQGGADYNTAAGVIVISRHRTLARAAFEEAAFALRTGEVSGLIEVDTGFVILRCRRHIPANTSARFEDVRESLKAQAIKRRMQLDAAHLLREMRAEARVKLLWTPVEDDEPVERPR